MYEAARALAPWIGGLRSVLPEPLFGTVDAGGSALLEWAEASICASHRRKWHRLQERAPKAPRPD